MNPLTTVRHILAWVEENVDLTTVGWYQQVNDSDGAPSRVGEHFAADSIGHAESLVSRIPWASGPIAWADGPYFLRWTGTAFGVQVLVTAAAPSAVAS